MVTDAEWQTLMRTCGGGPWRGTTRIGPSAADLVWRTNQRADQESRLGVYLYKNEINQYYFSIKGGPPSDSLHG